MYFSLIPNIEYDTKPIRYPFSESDYVIAKNFFRRFKVNEDLFSYAVYFKKYAIQDGERLDTIAEKSYGSPFFDWVIVLTNNLVNTNFDWPMTEYELRKHCESIYDDPYSEIKYYKTYEVKNDQGVTVLKPDLIVDESFYNSTFRYWNGINLSEELGQDISRPITVFEYEQEENEKRREIFILKPKYLDAFLTDFRKANTYTKSSDYINNRLKKTGT